MALVVKDRVKDTTTTTGTGTITLANSPPNGYQAFSSLGDGSTTYYAIEDADKTDWEVGLGTYTLSGHTLARTTVLASTNSNNAISLSSGEHTVFCDYPSGKAFLSDEGIDKTFTADGAITAGKPTILTSAGKAQQFTLTGNTVTEGTGTANSFNGSNAINYVSTSLAKVADDKVAVAYRDASNSNYGVVRVATVDDSGRTIAFGTAVVVNSVASNGTGVAYDTSRSVLGVTVQTESDPKLIIANYTISGTALTKQGSSLTLISSDEVKAHTALFDPDNNHIMVFLVYVNGSDRTFRAVAVTGNASGTPTSSYLVNVNVDTTFFDIANPFFATYDTNVNAFFVTSNKGEPSTFRAVVVTNSGSAITATERSKTKPTNYKEKPAICFDSNNNKVVMAYNTTSNYNEIVNITMTANDFTLGTPTAVTSLGTGASDSVSAGFASFDPTAQRVVILRGGGGAATSRWAVFSNDGTDFTQQSTGVWDSSTNNFAQRGGILQTAMTTNMTSNPIPIIMSDGNTGYAYSAVFTVGQSAVANLDNNYLGVASTTATDGNKVQVNIPNKSINVDQTGLTIGEEYFTDTTGAVRPFYSGGASLTTGEYLGTAVSATDLQLKETPTELIGNSGASITKGDPVVVKTNGDYIPAANTVVESSNSGSASSGSTGVIDAYVSDLFSMAVASDGTTYAFCYREQAGQANVIVGTRSGESITWGSPSILASANSLSHVVVYNPDQDVFVCLYTNQTTHKHFARAISYSGTTITMGDEVELLASAWSSGGVNNTITGVYDSNSKNVVAFFQGANNALGKKMTAVVLTASGTTLTAGSENANTTDGGQYIKGCDILNGKLLLYYRDGTQYYPNVIIATVDGNTVTWGSPTVIASVNYGSYCSPVYNPNYTNKAILIGKITTPNNYISYASLAISGTTITASNYSSGNINSASSYVETAGQVAVYSDFTGQYCVTYQDYSGGSTYYNAYRFMTTTNGETLTVGSQTTRTGDGTSQFYAGVTANDVNKYYVENNRDDNNTTYVYYVFNPTFSYTQTSTTVNLTAENYIGIAKSSSSAANKTAIITVDGGVDSNQSELTAGQLYYVQTDGTISTTAGSPSVVVGIGLSATKLLVTKS